MTELDGTWFDGVDSRARPVRLARDGTVLRVVGNERTMSLPLAAVTISARLGFTSRRLELPGHGHVQCVDSPQFDQWFPQRHRVEAAADWLERRRVPAMVAAIATLAAVWLFLQLGLPWTAEKVAPRIPAAVERAMATQVMGLLDKLEMKPSRLPVARQQRLRARLAALVQGLPRQRDMRLEFRDSKAFGPNAFVLPDGTVVMTDQLVALARNEAELVAVLAHEAGHHEHRHTLRRALESSGIFILASVLVGDVSGSSLTVSIPTVLLETGFSRIHEREADEFAIALLLERNYSPQAMADLLRRLHHKLDKLGEDQAYFSTHPPTAERIRRAEEAAQAQR